MLSRPQIALVAHALALIAILLVLVPILTSSFGTNGYLLVFAFYWLAFCVPVIVSFRVFCTHLIRVERHVLRPGDLPFPRSAFSSPGVLP